MTIKEVYEKIKNSPELKKKAAEAAKNGTIEQFLKDNNFGITVDQIKDFVASAKKGELSKEELNMAAGGGCEADECTLNALWSIGTLGIGCAISSTMESGKSEYSCSDAQL